MAVVAALRDEYEVLSGILKPDRRVRLFGDIDGRSDMIGPAGSERGIIPMAQEQKESTELSIEQAFARLDEITKALEDPQTSLEDSFALYKEGSDLLAKANQKIDMVQKQVQILQNSQQSAQPGSLDSSYWVE